MRKIIKYILTIIFSFCLVFPLVEAASYSVTVTSNSVTVGNSVTLKVNGSGLTGRFNISSSNTSVATVSGSSVWVENNTQSITVKTKKVGTTVITVTPTDGISDTMGNEVSLSAKKITITVKEKTVVQAKPKSTNSFLSSLTLDGYNLDSKFDKENLEYSVTVKEGTEKVKINAQLADSSATVTGIGEQVVTEGVNTFNIIVTAENGSKRTYVLKVLVKEFEPIEVTVDGSKYTVVRKSKDLPSISEHFIPQNITIDEEVVEGYYNEKLDYEIVGLKNELGNIKYFIYDNGKYVLYNEQVFNGMVLRVLEKELATGYMKTSFPYNGTNIDSYQEVELDLLKNTYALDNNEIEGNNFYLFYAINMETGKEELYQYDAVEKTVQRYNMLILDRYKEQSDTYYLYLLCSILVLGVTIVSFSITIICSNKRRKKLENKKNRKSRRNIERDLELD